jgi:hypothetical protein
MMKAQFRHDFDLIASFGAPLIKIEGGGKVPIEKWREATATNRTSNEFENCNVGIKCGSRLSSGGFLFILDIDPRNDGFGALKYLLEEHDFSIPQTFTVKTGSGGAHYYLRTSTPVGKCKLLNGIDGQGEGSYCVAPPSMHESGERYLIDDDSDIADCPNELIALLEAKANENMFFDGKTGHFSEIEEIEAGGRNDFLTQNAGALRRAGMDKWTIYAALKQINEDKCKPPVHENEIMTIAGSVMKYKPDELSVLSLPRIKEDATEMATPTKTENKFTEQFDEQLHTMSKTSNEYEKRMAKILGETEGLVFSIAHNVLKGAHRQYPQLALATAFGVVGACAQGSFKIQNKGERLSSYNWIVAPSAAGKNAYIDYVSRCLYQVDPRIVFDRLGSHHGLRSSLFVSNSGISVIDEFQDELQKLSGKGASSFQSQILTEMKELFNDLDELKAVRLAAKRYPAIKFPIYSVFAAGTIEGLTACLSNSVVGGGLASRFMVWPVINVPDKLLDANKIGIAESTIKQLRLLRDMSQTPTGRQQLQDIDAVHNMFNESVEKPDKKIEHIVQFVLGERLGMSDEAKDLLNNFIRSQEKLYKTSLSNNEAGNDVSAGSIQDRAPQYALKIAALHTCGKIMDTIEAKDMRIGIEISKLNTDWLANHILNHAGDAGFSKTVRRVKTAIAGVGRPASKRDIYAATGNHMKAQELYEALNTLALSGDVHVLTKGVDEPVDVETLGGLPRRGRYYFRAVDK